jgi:resolvase
MKTVRIYIKAAKDQADIAQQEELVMMVNAQGYDVSDIYLEQAKVGSKRPALDKLLRELEPGEIVVFENLEQVSRLPMEKLEALLEGVRSKKAFIAIPGLIDLSEPESCDQTEIKSLVFRTRQELLQDIILYIARKEYGERRRRQMEGIERAKSKGNYKGKQANLDKHRRVLELRRTTNMTLSEIAELVGLSTSMVPKILARYRNSDLPEEDEKK